MAPPLLLLSLFSSLLLLTVPCRCVVDATSATLAISQATGTVCGITAGSHHHIIHCTRFQESAGLLTASSPIYPTISFDYISGGPNFICSLRSGGSSFFCWDAIGQRIKRVYPGPTVLSQLSVGAMHVAAIDGDRRRIQWWRYGCNRHAEHCHHYFPTSVSGVYFSLTSGGAFTCALNGTRRVQCWGPGATPIQKKFSGVHMRTLTAGGDRMCGLDETGHLICTGDLSNVPSGEAFDFISLAIGSNQACAITRKDGTVVCWDRHGSYFPMGSTRFEFLVAGGDLTCGLTTHAFHVACWSLNARNSSAVILSLPKILPGVCVPDENFCYCGVYPNSGDLCGGSGVICKKSDTGGSTTKSCKFYPPIIERLKKNKGELLQKRWWFGYAIFGVAFFLYCIGSSICCWLNWHDELEENNAAAQVEVENLQGFTLKEIKTATNKFQRRLCSSQFGTETFLGSLADDRMVTVKRCNARSVLFWWCTARSVQDSHRVFTAEMDALTMAQHENIVKLIGYCTNKKERILVFEYISLGGLYGIIHTERQPTSMFFSSWKLRVKVVLDVAKGIQYLHQHREQRVIHRDITSANILVDENWVVKLSGFEMAVIGPEIGSDYVEIDVPTTGTAGYVDPECNANPCRAYQWNDVYSLGVVMLEVVTGRKASDGELVEITAQRIVDGKLMEVLDNRIPTPTEHELKAIERVAQLAQLCVRVPAVDRPNVGNVVHMLEAAFTLFNQPGASFSVASTSNSN